MVVFNPQIQPSNDPNWTGVSRPISDLPGDKSKALAISAATDALDTGVKVAENIDQDVIKEKTRAGVEALRDATTLAYETTRSSLIQGQQPPTAAANVAGLSLLQKTAQADVPEALQSGLDRAQDLATARAQGTLKANDTLYTGALNSLAKQLRAEYPGHKDFIDEQISRISGKNPANAYMDNLLTDISRLATGTDSAEKKLMNKAWENFGDPAVNLALKGYQAGLPGAKESLWKAVTGAEAEKLAHTKTMNDNAEYEAAGKVDTNLVRSQAQQSAQRTVFRNFNQVIETSGLSPKLVQQLITENQQGKITSMTPDQWESLAQNIESMKNTTLDQIKNNFNASGLSRRFAANGLTSEEKAIIDNEAQFFDRSIAAIRDPNKGMFFEMQRRAKGLQDNATYQAYSDPVMGKFLLNSKLIQDSAGPVFANIAAQEALKRGYLGPLQNFYGDAIIRAAVPDDIRKDGVAKSLTSDIQTAKRAASDLAAKQQKADPRIYEDLVKNVDLIEQANKVGRPDTAKEIVKYMFDPNRNADFVKQFSRDFKDSNGVDHKGYFNYYDIMTAPKVVNAIYGMKDTEASNMYHNWNEHQFRQLFGNEVQALNTIQGDKANPATLEWNTNTNEMTLKFSNKPQTSVDQNYQAWAKDSITRLNKGLGNLGYMFKKENQDPSEGIFTTLMQLSYTPREGLSGALPKMVIDAINASQFQPSAEDRLKGTFEKLGR